MPRQIVPTSGPGATDQWNFTGAATSWEAVARGSGDLSYCSAMMLGTTSDFFCGGGTIPLGGRIVGVTAHYRIRETDPGAGSTVDILITSGGMPHVVATVSPTSTWLDGEARVRESWLAPGTRPSLADVANLGVGIVVSNAPISGSVVVSQLWIEVEIIDTPFCYDPFDGVFPDAILGPLAWTTFGTQPVSLLANYLNITDASAVDFRLYRYAMSLDALRQDYVTEFETRMVLGPPAPGTPHVAVIFAMIDMVKAVGLSAIKIGADYCLGLYSYDYADPLAAFISAPCDFIGKDTHFRMVVDRDSNPGTYGKVSVYVNYASTPLIEWYFGDFAASSPAVPSEFGFGTTPDTQSALSCDYFSVKHYKKRGYCFRGWKELDLAANVIASSSADPDIVHHFTIDPPGVTAGQSENCCVLDVQDPTQPCRLWQDYQLPDSIPVTYKIDLDYKMVSPGPVTAELVIQRIEDQWYWGGMLGWTAVYSSTIIPFNFARTRVSLVTGLSTLGPDAITITVKNNLLAVLPHQILIYKVFLDRE